MSIPPKVFPDNITGDPATNPAVLVTVIRFDIASVAVAFVVAIVSEIVKSVPSIILLIQYCCFSTSPPITPVLNTTGFNGTSVEVSSIVIALSVASVAVASNSFIFVDIENCVPL